MPAILNGRALLPDVGVAIALGQVPGVGDNRKYGRDADIDVETADVQPLGGTYAFQTAEEVLEVLSSSGDDDGAPVGTGALTVTIEGLDDNYAEVTATVIMNGVGAVETVQAFQFVNRAYIATVGTGLTNAGNITIRKKTGPVLQAYIATGRGQTEQAIVTLPANKRALLVSREGNVAGKNAAIVDFDLFVKEFGGGWRVKATDSYAGGQGDSRRFDAPLSVGPKASIKMTATCDTINSECSAAFTYYLVDV